MATGYEAVVQVAAPGISESRQDGVVALIRQALPEEAAVDAAREGEGLALTVRLPLTGADASEVQLQAVDVVRAALERAGLTEEAATLNDVTVRSGS